MSWCVSIWVHPVWDPLCFLYLDIFSFFRFGNFSAIISSNTFFYYFLSLFSFWVPYNMMLVCLMLSQRSLKLFSLFRIYFSFCCSDWMIFIVCLPDYLYVLLYHVVCCSFFLVCFFFTHLLYSSVLTHSFLYFLVPC